MRITPFAEFSDDVEEIINHCYGFGVLVGHGLEEPIENRARITGAMKEQYMMGIRHGRDRRFSKQDAEVDARLRAEYGEGLDGSD